MAAPTLNGAEVSFSSKLVEPALDGKGFRISGGKLRTLPPPLRRAYQEADPALRRGALAHLASGGVSRWPLRKGFTVGEKKRGGVLAPAWCITQGSVGETSMAPLERACVVLQRKAESKLGTAVAAAAAAGASDWVSGSGTGANQRGQRTGGARHGVPTCSCLESVE